MKLSIRNKLLLMSILPIIIAISIFSVFSITSLQTTHEHSIAAFKQSLLDNKKQNLKNESEIVLNTIRKIQLENSIADSKSLALEMVRAQTYSDDGYFWIMDLKLNMLMHPISPELEGKSVAESQDANGSLLFMEMLKKVKSEGSGYVNYLWPKPGSDKPQPKLSYVVVFQEWGWIVGTGIYIDDIEQLVAKERERVVDDVFSLVLKNTGIGVIFCVLMFMIINLVVKRFLSPLLSMVGSCKHMAKGDFTEQVAIDQTDEIGDMSRALASMAENLSGMIREINEDSHSLESSSTELNTIAGQVSANSEAIVDKINSVSAAAEEMSINMSSVASAMEQTTSNTEAVAAAAEELDSNIAGIVDGVDKNKKRTDDAVTLADEVLKNVETLGSSAAEIGTVTETITAISDKTSLLALNATIEAARAGDAGKGFAVVAGEIKQLATQTAAATIDIGRKLKGIQESTGTTITGITEIANIVKKISSTVSYVRESMNQQRLATSEIAENITQASEGIKEISINISQTAQASSEITNDISFVNTSATEVNTSMSELNQSAEELNRLALQLKENVDKFKIE